METHLNDLDAAFLFKGAPNDQCQAPHIGYVLKGKYGMRIADGVEEVFEAGDAFFIGPGHTPIIFAGCEVSIHGGEVAACRSCRHRAENRAPRLRWGQGTRMPPAGTSGAAVQCPPGA